MESVTIPNIEIIFAPSEVLYAEGTIDSVNEATFYAKSLNVVGIQQQSKLFGIRVFKGKTHLAVKVLEIEIAFQPPEHLKVGAVRYPEDRHSKSPTTD